MLNQDKKNLKNIFGIKILDMELKIILRQSKNME